MRFGVLLVLATGLLFAGASPTDGGGWFTQGLAQHKQGSYDEAIESFQQALKLKFNAPAAMMRIGRAYAKKGDVENALAWMGRSAEAGFAMPGPILADPDSADARKDARFAAILERMKKNATPCENDPGYRAFDFWIGEWQVETPNNPTKSASSIQKILGGCVILENWYGGGMNAGPGTTGKSMNYYTPATGKWKQVWVYDTGAIAEYEGEVRDGAMHYKREFEQGQAHAVARMTFTPIEGGKVRQLIEQSLDEGKTWTTQFDGIYARQ